MWVTCCKIGDCRCSISADWCVHRHMLTRNLHDREASAEIKKSQMTSACLQESYHINNSEIWAERERSGFGGRLWHLSSPLREQTSSYPHLSLRARRWCHAHTSIQSKHTETPGTVWWCNALFKRDFSQHTDLRSRRWMWMFYGCHGNSCTQSSWTVFLAGSEKSFNDWCGLTAGRGSRSSSGCLRLLCLTQLILWG